jgi:hypothetical protein
MRFVTSYFNKTYQSEIDLSCIARISILGETQPCGDENRLRDVALNLASQLT